MNDLDLSTVLFALATASSRSDARMYAGEVLRRAIVDCGDETVRPCRCGWPICWNDQRGHCDRCLPAGSRVMD